MEEERNWFTVIRINSQDKTKMISSYIEVDEENTLQDRLIELGVDEKECHIYKGRIERVLIDSILPESPPEFTENGTLKEFQKISADTYPVSGKQAGVTLRKVLKDLDEEK